MVIGMSDSDVVVFLTGSVAVVFLIVGLYTVSFHSRVTYEDTEILQPGSKIVLEEDLLRGDQVHVRLGTLRNRSVLSITGGGVDYRIDGTSIEVTVPVSNDGRYRFEVTNPNEEYVFVSYHYDVTYAHSYWTGIASVSFAAAIGIALSFRFREELKKELSSRLAS